MTAIAQRRRRRTIFGFVGVVLLVVAAGAMFAVGVITLSNSQEGEAVGIETRPVSALPATPNALIAVADGDELVSVVVATLLPAGQGGSIVTMPVDADATAAFGVQRRPLNELFVPADPEGVASAVEEMLSITVERTEIIDVDRLAELVGAPASVEVASKFDDQFWTDLAEAAPIADGSTAPVDGFGQPIPPATVGALMAQLLAGDVQTRALVTRPATDAENPTGADVVVIDRRDANLVFAQVSPSLVSTPNPGLTLRIVAPFSDEQIAASDGRYESTSELMLDAIGEMLFFQANVVSVDTQPTPDGAASVTLIEVAEERFIADMEAIAPIVFGESEVVLATSLIEGVDVVVTLGTDYIAKKAALSTTDAPTVPTDPTTVPGDTVKPDE